MFECEKLYHLNDHVYYNYLIDRVLVCYSEQSEESFFS